MAKLSLSLLGPFQATLDGAPIGSFKTDKVRALLAYLAVEANRPHRRETLCGLLWPESTDDSARASLRNALSLLRRAIRDRDASSPHLLVERETIQFNAESAYWLDVEAFGDAVATSKAHAHDALTCCPECMARLGEAVGLYSDEFLAGFSVDSAPLEEWLVVRREALHLQVLEALDHLALYHEAAGAYGRMLEAARRQVALEPWRERAHRQWMRALALSGQRGAALAQYEACRQVLDEELGIEPEPATEALYQRVREGALQPPGGEVVRPPPVPSSVGPAPLPPAAEAEPAVPGAVPSLSGSVLGQVEGQRRYVTTLFCSVESVAAVGGALDIEARAQAMSGALWLVESEVVRLGGEVSQRREDGLVATSGATTAHEDDPERAVLAALAMEDAIGRYAADLARGEGIELRVRMGVSSGEAIVTRVGEGESQRVETVLSEGASLGERLLKLSGTEGVLVSAQTYHLVAPLFEWQVLGECVLEGAQAPVTLYRPLAHRPEAGKGRGIEGLASPLVGRERELSALQGAVARVRAGSGGIVTVVGEAGLGKSRLLAEIRKDNLAKVSEPLQGWDVSWAEGRCLSYGGTVAYLPWLDMLRGVVGVAADVPPVEARDALRERVRALCGDRASEVYPYLGRMLSLPLEEDAEARMRGLDAEGVRVLTFRAVQTLLEYVAGRDPLVIVCEDLHWADPTSLALLEQVFALTDRVPVLFVCVLRPETEHGCWRIREVAARDYRHRHVDLWLKPLSGEESERLVRSLLEIEELPPALRERIVRYTEGNPLYLEEVLRSLIAEGAIAYDQETGRWQAVGDVATLSIPDTLQGVLMARVDRLPWGSRQVLQLAAVIGHVFARRVLAAVMGEREGLDEHLVLLQRAQMIREQARLPELEYAFHHQLTMEAAYESLLRRKQRALHRRVAEALEQLYADRIEERLGLLAHHWERAGEATQAVHYLRRAGEQAAAQYANAEAIDYLGRALDLVVEDDLAERYALLRAREGALDLQGIREAQRDDLEALQALANALADPIRQADVALCQAHYASRTQDYDGAVAAARRAVAYAQDAQDVSRQAAAHREVGRALRYMEKVEPARAELERALLLARAAGVRPIEADTLHELGACSDEFGGSDDYWMEELGICREIGDRQREGRALRDLGELQLKCGQYTKAMASFEESLRVCEATGNRRDEGWALHYLGLAYGQLGDSASARAFAERAAFVHRATGDHLGMEVACWILARACAQEGDYAGVREWLAQAPGIGGMRVWLSANVSWAQGDVEHAKREYRDALHLARTTSHERTERAALYGLAAVALAEGDLNRAQRYTEELWTDLQARPWADTLSGFRPHLVCYRVLRANGDPRADAILEQAYRMLEQRAAQIDDEVLRRSYLENVPANRELIAAFEQR